MIPSLIASLTAASSVLACHSEPLPALAARNLLVPSCALLGCHQLWLQERLRHHLSFLLPQVGGRHRRVVREKAEPLAPHRFRNPALLLLERRHRVEVVAH